MLKKEYDVICDINDINDDRSISFELSDHPLTFEDLAIAVQEKVIDSTTHTNFVEWCRQEKKKYSSFCASSCFTTTIMSSTSTTQMTNSDSKSVNDGDGGDASTKKDNVNKDNRNNSNSDIKIDLDKLFPAVCNNILTKQVAINLALWQIRRSKKRAQQHQAWKEKHESDHRVYQDVAERTAADSMAVATKVTRVTKNDLNDHDDKQDSIRDMEEDENNDSWCTTKKYVVPVAKYKQKLKLIATH